MARSSLEIERSARKGQLVIRREGDDLVVEGEGRLTLDDWKRISDEFNLPNYERVYPSYPYRTINNPWWWNTNTSTSTGTGSIGGNTWTSDTGTTVQLLS